MREQEFGLQAGGFHAAFAEKFSAFLNGFQNGHGTNLNRKAKVGSGKYAGRGRRQT